MRATGPLPYAQMLAMLGGAAPARAELPTYKVQYGSREQDFAVVHPAAGSAPLLLLHQAGGHTPSTEHIAFAIQREGSFTVLNLEWQEDEDGRSIWEFDVGQIEEAIAYVRLHAAELNVDPSRLAMLGGSRGANLSLLTSLEENAAAPGTVKAVVDLSGDADPAKQIERARNGELSKTVARKLSNVYGCEPVLKSCPMAYIERWSPIAQSVHISPRDVPRRLRSGEIDGVACRRVRAPREAGRTRRPRRSVRAGKRARLQLLEIHAPRRDGVPRRPRMSVRGGERGN